MLFQYLQKIDDSRAQIKIAVSAIYYHYLLTFIHQSNFFLKSMKFFALTFAGALAQELPVLPPLPTDAPSSTSMMTTMTTTRADKVTNEERCGSLSYHMSYPQPTGKELCPSVSLFASFIFRNCFFSIRATRAVTMQKSPTSSTSSRTRTVC